MPISDRDELKKMIADYMEQGFLSNITAMFKADPSLYEIVADLIKDERLMVRVGATALVEELHQLRPDDAQKAAPSLVPLLADKSPTVRGDAAYLIGLVGQRTHRDSLKALLDDPNPHVVEIVKDALEES